jgi:DNA primase
MIEAAREGCDLGAAEGRASMASNAQPLWSALPEGALKRQLLGEIAALVQLSARELGELWTAATPSAGGGESSRFPADRRRFKPSHAPSPRPPPAGRRPPTSRADVAARLILANMAEWEHLSHELHDLLCEQPGEHGSLFGWLDSQVHEHGVQPWAALREGLRGQPFEALALRVMTGPDGAPLGGAEGDQAADAASELRNVLDYMLNERLKAQENEAIAAVGTDPLAVERYNALKARRFELLKRLKSG